MITLITGVPGSGKTLYGISYIKKKAEDENREVYYSGINDLKLPWIELDDPTQWHRLPAGSIIVIDECQRHFRPRSAGSGVPEHVSRMETHRHDGYDIFLITQHPMLLDNNVRRLVGQHFHVVRKFGLQGATVHEWGSTHEISQRNLMEAVKHKFPYTEEAFSFYKSAEIHTHKRRLPARVYFLFAMPFLLAGLAYYGVQSYMKVSDAKGRIETVAGKPDKKDAVAVSPEKAATVSKAEYLASLTPRVAGMAWTAPAYDDVTKPIDAPRPVGCMISKKKCRCVDQQGNSHFTTDDFCRAFVEHGMFVSWKRPESSPVRQDRVEHRPEGGAVPVDRQPEKTRFLNFS